ncbi:RHS repeat-associated core domain-containing protein [Pasteurellaceae bacterium LIM206]|nr:RHS repeat-associated core domain-containing protein [Pasteurellaceae bacterium LIM206]
MHYVVADQIGTITELMTEDGYIDYRQKLNLWGDAEIDGYRHYAANDTNPLKCNHRFVGQYYDEESGLHYNRFRYYSPETGQYISHDPIGLLGGFNPYGYVGIPTSFVDPLGLASCPTTPSSASKMNQEVKRGQAPKDVVRVDRGHIPGQESHVHYRDRTSSTVSGKVHDAHKGIPNPSKAVKSWLKSHGWTPPE